MVMMLETMIRMNTSNKKCNMPLTSHFSDYTSHLPPVRTTGNPSKELLLTAVSEFFNHFNHTLQLERLKVI